MPKWAAISNDDVHNPPGVKRIPHGDVHNHPGQKTSAPPAPAIKPQVARRPRSLVSIQTLGSAFR